MNVRPPGTSTRWLRRWSRLGIARRIAVSAVAMTLTFTFVTGLLSFAMTWKVVRRSIDERLEMDALRTSQRLERALDGVAAEFEHLSRNSLITNALVDSHGREAYVTPFIQDLKLARGAPFHLALCDFQGREIAGNGPRGHDHVGVSWLADVIEHAQAHGEVVEAPHGAELLVAYPVVYPATGMPEGMLVGTVQLRDGLRHLAGDDRVAWRLLDGRGRAVSASRDDLHWPTMLTITRPLAVVPPLDALGLVVETGIPRSRALGPLKWLVAGYCLAAALLLVAALAVSRALAERVTRPLRRLASAADAIAAAGTFGMTAPVEGPDETARLAAAFNEMLRRLREASEVRYAIQVAHTRDAESALRGAHEAMEQATEAIAILDRKGAFTYANRAARRLAERDEHGLVGLRFWDFDPSRSEAWWEQLWAEIVERRSVLVTSTLRGARTIEIETSFTAFQVQGREYCVVTARDITDRTKAEQMGRMVSLGTLAAGVAHEINNPLAYVMANLDYLAGAVERASAREVRRDEAQQLREAVADSQEGVRRVKDIVRSLKRFSSPERATRVPVDVRSELQVAIALAANDIRHRARLGTDLQPVPPVLAAEHELGQVFVNLLVNAAQAIPEGHSGSNEVRISCSVAPGGEVAIEVRDTGAGIPAGVLPRIFEPFFTTKPVGIGTGLGLSICHGIVAQLGGRIDVQSEVGRGTTFRVLLPAAPDATAAADAASIAARADAPCRILVVDDEPRVGPSLARMMGTEARVESICSARAALARIEAGASFDAIFCDLMMPEMSGIQFHEALRTCDPAAAARVVFVTGGAFTPAARAFLASVTNPVVEKPFGRDAVHDVMLALASRDGSGACGDRPPEGGAQVRPLRVLIADDEANVRRSLGLLLRSSGHRVIECHGGRDAVARYRAEADGIDVAILDLRMADLGGRDVVAQLRAVSPRFPVIVSSGMSAGAEVDALSAEPGVYFLPKPYTTEELERALFAAVAGHERAA